MDIVESNHTIIQNKPTRNESTLVFVDEFRDEGSQLVNQALRNNIYTAKNYLSGILQICGMGNLWDHNYGVSLTPFTMILCERAAEPLQLFSSSEHPSYTDETKPETHPYQGPSRG
jgi:hypothetical protein